MKLPLHVEDVGGRNQEDTAESRLPSESISTGKVEDQDSGTVDEIGYESDSETDEDDVDQLEDDVDQLKDNSDIHGRDREVRGGYSLRKRSTLRRPQFKPSPSPNTPNNSVLITSRSKGKQRAVTQSDGRDGSAEEEEGQNTKNVYCWNQVEYWAGTVELPNGFWPFEKRDRRVGRMQLAVSQNIRLYGIIKADCNTAGFL